MNEEALQKIAEVLDVVSVVAEKDREEFFRLLNEKLSKETVDKAKAVLNYYHST